MVPVRVLSPMSPKKGCWSLGPSVPVGPRERVYRRVPERCYAARRPSKTFLGSTLPLGEADYIAVHSFARLSDAFVVMVNQHSQRREDRMIRR